MGHFSALSNVFRFKVVELAPFDLVNFAGQTFACPKLFLLELFDSLFGEECGSLLVLLKFVLVYFISGFFWDFLFLRLFGGSFFLL